MTEPVEVPPLLECPTCGLPVQEGDMPPHLLAWHDCDYVRGLKVAANGTRVTVDDATEKLLSLALTKAAGMSGRELGALLESVASLNRARQAEQADGTIAISGEMAEWLRPRADE